VPRYHLPPLPTLRSASEAGGRCLSPTSATDVAHEHPCTSSDCRARGLRRIDLAHRSSRPPKRKSANDRRGARPPCGDPTPADPRLTARCQLRSCLVHTAHCPRRPPLGARCVGIHRGTHGAVPFSDTTSLHERPLTPPVTRGCGEPLVRTAFPHAEGRLDHRLVKGDGLRRPETPSAARCPLSKRLRACSYLFWMGACHRARCLAAIEPASGAVSPFCALAQDGLGLVRDPRALRTRAIVAGRRLSVSAIESIHEHDRVRPNSAAPHPQSPAGAAFLPAVAPFRMRAGLRMAGLACTSWPAEVPRLRGRRRWAERIPRLRRATPSTAIARGRSFAPTRSTRAPHVARRDEHRPETTSSPETRCARLSRCAWRNDARAPPCLPCPAAAGAPG
jgi:hypothetical protein